MLAVLVVVGLDGRGLSAQEPDTVPAPPEEGREGDRIRPQPPDTTPRPVLDGGARQDTTDADTLGPPPSTLPGLDPLGPVGWARGVWEWDREALLGLPDLSLLQLLERIPGVVPVHPDIANQPEGAAVFGAAAGGIRYIVDGFELDALDAPTFDPSRLPLLAFRRVRVERGVTGATVRIETLSPDHPQSQSVIEAGTGDLGANLFRGMFLSPQVLGGPLALGFERLAVRGGIPGGSSNHLAGWLKWTWVRDGSGLQIEYRQGTMDRSGVGSPLAGTRTDWVVRGRTALGPVTGEVYAGASRVEEELSGAGAGPGGGDGGDDQAALMTGSPQAGLRLRTALAGPLPVEARAALRWRDHPLLPTGVAELGVRAAPLSWLTVEADAERGWWSDGAGTGRWSGRAQAGPFFGVSVFGELYAGSPPVSAGSGLRLLSPDSLPLRISRDGARLGAEVRYAGFALGAAAVRATTDTLPGFGLPFEALRLGAPGGVATGFEAVTTIPTGWDPLHLEAWYVRMNPSDDWLYLPRRHWRASLVYHHLPLPSGNLEISARAEHVFRGRMAAPEPVDPQTAPAVPAIGEVNSYRATNLELTIRVLTVRAFLRWENIFHRRLQADIPGFPVPGQHALYGVKWEFTN